MQYYDKIKRIAELAADASKENSDIIFSLINEDNDLEKELFRTITSIAWFNLIKEKDYYNPEHFAKNEKGEVLFPRSFDYLERVSEQVPEYPEYGKELIDIIGNIVKYSRKQKKIDNYYIWWYCVKILNNIPNTKIKECLSPEIFRIWFNEWTDRSSVQHQTIADVGEKLLPKFLCEDSMSRYAEAIIRVITDIRESDQSKAIIGRKDADLVWDSYWLLEAFKRNLKQIAGKISDKVIFDVADKLKSALEYEHNETRIDIEPGANKYQLRVSRAPIEGMRTGEIGYQPLVYDCTVRQYSPEEQEKTKAKNDFWTSRNIKPERIIGKDFRITATTSDEYISQIKRNLPANIDWSKDSELDQKIHQISRNMNTDYSSIWFKSLANDDPVSLHDAHGALTSILRDVLLARCELKKNKVGLILESFLSDKYPFPIFKRIVLLILNSHWAEYPSLFSKFIDGNPNVLAYSDCEVELQDILRNHNKDFSSELKNRLKQLIEDVPKYYQEEGPKQIAYWKYKWLSPLKENDEFTADYIEAKKQAEIKDDNAYEPDRSTMEMKEIGNVSSLSVEELLKMPVIDQIKYFLDFKGTDDWGRMEGKPDKEGLANTLQAAVKAQPEKYINDLKMFNKQGLYLYVNAIIRGFCDASKAGKLLPWTKIFNFSRAYINQEWFLDEAFQAQGNDRGQAKGEYVWVIESIADLIKEGSRDGDRAIGPDNFVLLENLYDDMCGLINGASEPDIDRFALSYALNTTLGQVTESYIVFSLRVARVNKKPEEAWGDNKYERFLGKGIEPYTWLGRYLPNIKYLDAEYAKRKIEEISKLDVADKKWRSFMEGYLFGAYVYDYIYKLMSDHYLKALKGMPFEKEGDRRLVQHIALGYLRNLESLEQKNSNGQESLFFKMLADTDTPEKRNRWIEVANFFWSMASKNTQKGTPDDKEKISGEMKEKILNFWAWTVEDKENVKARLGEDYASFLGRMADLTILLPKIDEKNEEWLMLSAAHIEERRHMTFFIDYLARFEDAESLKRIGKIYLEVLKGTTPTFRQEDIQLIVKRLYDLAIKTEDPKIKRDVKTDADNICNTYGRRGVHFLKELYEKNQK